MRVVVRRQLVERRAHARERLVEAQARRVGAELERGATTFGGGGGAAVAAAAAAGAAPSARSAPRGSQRRVARERVDELAQHAQAIGVGVDRDDPDDGRARVALPASRRAARRRGRRRRRPARRARPARSGRAATRASRAAAPTPRARAAARACARPRPPARGTRARGERGDAVDAAAGRRGIFSDSSPIRRIRAARAWGDEARRDDARRREGEEARGLAQRRHARAPLAVHVRVALLGAVRLAAAVPASAPRRRDPLIFRVVRMPPRIPRGTGREEASARPRRRRRTACVKRRPPFRRRPSRTRSARALAAVATILRPRPPRGGARRRRCPAPSAAARRACGTNARAAGSAA